MKDRAYWIERAARAIARDDQIIYDVAAGVGQIVGNVKHMRWFRLAVAQELAGNRCDVYGEERR